jgi:hypothetical protein
MSILGNGIMIKAQLNSVSSVPVTPAPPTVEVTSLGDSHAFTQSIDGNVTDGGSQPVTARGVCYNTTGSPTIADFLATSGSGIGAFVSTLLGLTRNTDYFVRAYATNSVGTSYGEEISFSTLKNNVIPFPTPEWSGISFVNSTGVYTWASQQILDITNPVTFEVFFNDFGGVAHLYAQVSPTPIAYGNGDTGLVDPSLVAGMVEIAPFTNLIAYNGDYIIFAIAPDSGGFFSVSELVDMANIDDGGSLTDQFSASLID